MVNNNLFQHPHRRLNLLTGEWVLVSPQRSKRPWQGQIEETPSEKLPPYDPKCYLCPGNDRAGGKKNPRYQNTFVFDNDFSALMSDTPPKVYNKADLLIAHAEPGICRVICFSPRHDLTLPEMTVTDIQRVVEVWTEEYRKLGENPDINYVQIFENKGAMMGCSNPHPHGQIWAQKSIPVELTKEIYQMGKYYLSK
jgi:UDPglucose--hexose-1-phosphate uridylyltransferase